MCNDLLSKLLTYALWEPVDSAKIWRNRTHQLFNWSILVVLSELFASITLSVDARNLNGMVTNLTFKMPGKLYLFNIFKNNLRSSNRVFKNLFAVSRTKKRTIGQFVVTLFLCRNFRGMTKIGKYSKKIKFSHYYIDTGKARNTKINFLDCTIRNLSKTFQKRF